MSVQYDNRSVLDQFLELIRCGEMESHQRWSCICASIFIPILIIFAIAVPTSTIVCTKMVEGVEQLYCTIPLGISVCIPASILIGLWITAKISLRYQNKPNDENIHVL